MRNAYVIPIHEGWTVEETIRWIGQGLLLPDVEPLEWATIVCDVGCRCDLCEK